MISLYCCRVDLVESVNRMDTDEIGVSIELDGSLVKPNSRRWHHSLGNALWHTVSERDR
jgi:hypothetical protein